MGTSEVCLGADAETRTAERARRTGSEGAGMTKVGVVKFSGSSGGGSISGGIQTGNVGVSFSVVGFLLRRSWICF